MGILVVARPGQMHFSSSLFLYSNSLGDSVRLCQNVSLSHADFRSDKKLDLRSDIFHVSQAQSSAVAAVCLHLPVLCVQSVFCSIRSERSGE